MNGFNNRTLISMTQTKMRKRQIKNDSYRFQYFSVIDRTSKQKNQ